MASFRVAERAKTTRLFDTPCCDARIPGPSRGWLVLEVFVAGTFHYFGISIGLFLRFRVQFPY